MGRENRPGTAAHAPPPLETFLEQEGDAPIPAPRRDLVVRTIRRIQHWVVLGDLLRLVTLENYWKAIGRHRDAAENSHNSKKS